jgi:cytochrome oxidase Cu insertion factor (SCO1/SenC/PrrC family)
VAVRRLTTSPLALWKRDKRDGGKRTMNTMNKRSPLWLLGAVLVSGGIALAQDSPVKPATGTGTEKKAEEKQAMETPKVGVAAPDFKIKDDSGKAVSLSQFKGKQNVLIAFFPKAFTGG